MRQAKGDVHRRVVTSMVSVPMTHMALHIVETLALEIKKPVVGNLATSNGDIVIVQ